MLSELLKKPNMIQEVSVSWGGNTPLSSNRDNTRRPLRGGKYKAKTEEVGRDWRVLEGGSNRRDQWARSNDQHSDI